MATMLARPISPPAMQSSGATPTMQHLTLNTSLAEASRARRKPTAVPNKHIPYCSPGPVRSPASPITPSAPSPKVPETAITSILYPPDKYTKLENDPPIYAINAPTLEHALDHIATQSLPDPELVFPWLHGLHAENQFQLNFFNIRSKSMRRVPKCLRGITIVKAGGDLSFAKLKGAVAPEEFVLTVPRADSPSRSRRGGRTDSAIAEDKCFLEADPMVGFSCRNFHIQACKMATVSDIVVYGDDGYPHHKLLELARQLSQAQNLWSIGHDRGRSETPRFNTFILSDPFYEIEDKHPNLVAIGAYGEKNSRVIDLPSQEREEMAKLSEASKISYNVWLGSTIDPSLGAVHKKSKYDCCIEAGENFQLHDEDNLNEIEKIIRDIGAGGIVDMQAPGSGTITFEGDEGIIDYLLPLVQWVHKLANPIEKDKTALRFLVHCADGYTETSLFALAYVMYAEGIPAHEAYILLHREKGRNFFAYPGDKQLLYVLQRRILKASPKNNNSEVIDAKLPFWFSKMDGSLPSRIMPYLYLGNLTHANNPGLLKQLGIRRILSVGEPITWPNDQHQSATDRLCWPKENFLYIDNVQDNGIDPLTCEFMRCLEFIEQGKKDGTATLVHCRVGVSRSATICIAEVMNELGLSFPRAYCFVRARRLNVIIQPHLRFAYELLKWEETQCERRGVPLRRELEWGTLAREIALMNKPYCGPR